MKLRRGLLDVELLLSLLVMMLLEKKEEEGGILTLQHLV